MRCAWAIVCLAAATGCPSVGSYRCDRDEDCNRGGAAGRCLADAACAYPEAQGRCESGWARSPNAAESPGACIDPPTSTGDDGSSGTSTGSAASSSSGTGAETGDLGCMGASIEIDTSVFSPGAGLTDFVLWLPLDAWPQGVAALESGQGLSIADAEGTPLPHERRALSSGHPALWVRLPDFEADETVSLRATFGPDLDGADPSGVWASSYVGVWHLDDTPMGLDGDIARNAAVPDEPGMLYGGMQPEQQIEGPLGPALAFDGEDDEVEVRADFIGQLDAYTISMWVRADDPELGARGSFFDRLNGDYLYPRCWHGTDTSGRLICQHSVSDAVNSTSSPEDLEIGTFVHLALARDPETGATAMYLQGEQVGTITDVLGDTLDTNPEPLPMRLGNGEWGTLLGALDEIRVSDRALPSGSIRADFRSQRGGLEIATYGPLEPVSCPP